MWYGEGRLWGNIGTYVVDEAKDAWDAERLIRNATATKEQAHLPKKLKKANKQEEDIIIGIQESAVPHNHPGTHVYNLGYGVDFFEFWNIGQLAEKEE